MWAAGGQNHSLAVTAAGEIWAWGGNLSGQVGDGTTNDQPLPVLVVPAGFAWRLPRPVMSPPPGFYTTTVDVSVTTPVAGAALYYTTDGSEPTEASSIVTGPIPITGSTELKARAFKAGLSPSATAGGLYTLNFGILDPPVPNPAGGTYVTSVDVTLTAAPGATISFELCDPNLSNCTVWAAYTGPIQIDRSRILRASASQPDWSTSSLLTETYTVQAAQPLPGSCRRGVLSGSAHHRHVPRPGYGFVLHDQRRRPNRKRSADRVRRLAAGRQLHPEDQGVQTGPFSERGGDGRLLAHGGPHTGRRWKVASSIRWPSSLTAISGRGVRTSAGSSERPVGTPG